MNLVFATVVVYNLYMKARCLDYCNIDCGNGPGQHTLCKYPANTPSECSHFMSDISEQVAIYQYGEDRYESIYPKDYILRIHNTRRQQVASGKQTGHPAASNMMEIEWDDELANIAQRWSLQCTMQLSHDSCRNTGDGKTVGQNIGMNVEHFIEPPKFNIHGDILKNVLEVWYTEVNDLADIPANFYRFDPLRFMSVGHFTQMVWGSTRKIGCGLSTGTKSKLFTGILVCNYQPAGNVMNKPIYRAGEACSACPAGTNCSVKYPGLCSGKPLNNQPEEEEEGEWEDLDNGGTKTQILGYISYTLILLTRKIVEFYVIRSR